MKTITPNTNLVNKRKQIKHITNKFDKGHSERIWKEFFKVIDLSDLIVEVLDARNPSGTRSHYIEQYIKKQSPNKHLIIILNKCDLVPSYVTKEWLHSISKEFPTVAFHCSVTNPFGKGALLSVLRQISHLKTDKPFLKVCFIGFPNVGKSSVINALKTKEVCKVANRPGETKVWQLIVLMKKLFLLDCPGFVHFNTRDSEVDTIVNGVKRVENISDASAYLPMILRSVKPHFLQRTYQIRYWSSAEDFITQLAMKSGRIITKGQPDIETSAKMILLDYQSGKNPLFKLTHERCEKDSKKHPIHLGVSEPNISFPEKNNSLPSKVMHLKDKKRTKNESNMDTPIAWNRLW
jgi:nuclear GTP-binding protein